MRIRSLALGLFALTFAFAACGGGSDGKSEPPTTPSTTAPAAPTQVTVGQIVTAAGTQLAKPANPDTRRIDAERACRTFVDTPEGNCEIAMMAGGNALWSVEPMAESGPGERQWRVRIRARSKAMPDGGWDIALELPATAVFANVGVRSHDVTGDGKPELLVGYRSGGTGQFESYDIVTYHSGKPLEVAVHRERLHKGSVALDGPNVVDYSADEASPECCPTTAHRTVIALDGEEFRVKSVNDVPIDAQPPDLFA